MPLLVSLDDIRDVFLIIYAALGLIVLVIVLVVTVVVGFSIKGLIRTLNSMLDESVRPAVTSIRDAAETIRGTTEFVGKTAITPIVKTYGAFAGLRKGLGVISGLSRRRR